MRQQLESACTHTELRPTGPLLTERPRELLLPLPPHQSVLTGCRVLVRAHLYAGARYIGLEFWVLSIRSGRIRRSTGAICTVLQMDF
jgi:hypothetical protein